MCFPQIVDIIYFGWGNELCELPLFDLKEGEPHILNLHILKQACCKCVEGPTNVVKLNKRV